jgi:hypothetical protein
MQIIATTEELGRKCATITWEISRMLDEATEMRKQFRRYAYVIAAFGPRNASGYVRGGSGLRVDVDAACRVHG